MPSAAHMMPDISLRFLDSSRYQLLNPLGAGAFGVVYRAREYIPNSNRTALRAIKVIPHFPDSNKVGHSLAFQLREIKLHKLVSSHPNVVTVHRVFRDRQFLYIVMEYYPGGDLFKVIRHKRTLARNNAMVKNIFLQLLDGVEWCHTKGVFHRDLKPENIMANDDLTRIWIGDFGLATNLPTSTSYNTGSKYYMCPECVQANDKLDPYDTRRSDIWALGLVLLHIVSGRLPWQRATLDDPYFVAFLKEPNFLRELFPISQALESLLRDILTPVPGNTPTIRQIRASVRTMDSFWMTKAEIARANPTVRRLWEAYQPPSGHPSLVERWNKGKNDDEHDDDAETESEWEGDVLDSETSSESSRVGENESDRTDSHKPEHLGATSQSLGLAEEGLAGRAQMQLPADLCRDKGYLGACSSDEFPVRERGNGRVRALEVKSSSSSGSSPGSSPGGAGLAGPLGSSSGSESDEGPVTPETRPQDPPDVVVAEPLDAISGVQERNLGLGTSDEVKITPGVGKVPSSGRARISRLIRQLVPNRRRSC